MSSPQGPGRVTNGAMQEAPTKTKATEVVDRLLVNKKEFKAAIVMTPAQQHALRGLGARAKALQNLGKAQASELIDTMREAKRIKAATAAPSDSQLELL